MRAISDLIKRQAMSGLFQPPPEGLSHVERITYLHKQQERINGYPMSVDIDSIIISESGQRIIEWFDLPDLEKDHLIIYRHLKYSKWRTTDSIEEETEYKIRIDKIRQLLKDDEFDLAVEVFLVEMQFIAMMYMLTSAKPTKETMLETLSDLRKIQKLITDINEITRGYLLTNEPLGNSPENRKDRARHRNKTAFFRLQDDITREYQRLKREQNLNENDGMVAVKHFFMAGQWLEPSISGVLNGSLAGYFAKDRSVVVRDSAIKALADSYWCCFGIKPTATVTAGKKNFYSCVKMFYSLLDETLDISNSSANSLLKKCIKAVVTRRGE